MVTEVEQGSGRRRTPAPEGDSLADSYTCLEEVLPSCAYGTR